MTPPEAKAAAMLASPDDIEAQFYEALQQGDIVRLMAAWADDEDVICVHPGGPRVVGPAAIRASFEAIFANGAIPVQIEGVRRLEAPGCAVHNVFERIDLPAAQGTQTAWVVATNVYVKTSQGWRLAAHHASASATLELPDLGDLPATLH